MFDRVNENDLFDGALKLHIVHVDLETGKPVHDLDALFPNEVCDPVCKRLEFLNTVEGVDGDWTFWVETTYVCSVCGLLQNLNPIVNRNWRGER